MRSNYKTIMNDTLSVKSRKLDGVYKASSHW